MRFSAQIRRHDASFQCGERFGRIICLSMGRPKTNNLPAYTYRDPVRDCFYVTNPLNGKKKRFESEKKARETARLLRRWVDLQRRNIPGYRLRSWRLRTARKKPTARQRSQARRRYLQVKRATPVWADRKAIKAAYVAAKAMTLRTGILHTVDHVIPIQGRTVCGLHVETNLAILSLSDNSRKSNLFDGG